MDALSRVLDAYRTGRGRVVVRGKAEVELLDPKTKRNAVIITEVINLVFQINVQFSKDEPFKKVY